MRLSRLVKIWWVQKGGGRRERLAWVGAARRARHWRPPPEALVLCALL